MGVIVAGLRPISKSLIIINNLLNIVKIGVAGIMRPKPMSSIITTYITPLLTMNNFINVM